MAGLILSQNNVLVDFHYHSLFTTMIIIHCHLCDYILITISSTVNCLNDTLIVDWCLVVDSTLINSDWHSAVSIFNVCNLYIMYICHATPRGSKKWEVHMKKNKSDRGTMDTHIYVYNRTSRPNTSTSGYQNVRETRGQNKPRWKDKTTILW